MAKNISKQIQEILKTGTPKQKAVLICMRYREPNAHAEKPLLTEEEVEALSRDSFSGKDPKEGKEFNKWIAVYNTYTRMAPFFGLAYAEYKANANYLLCCIRQWEDYTKEENHLNTILADLKEQGNKEGVKSFYESLEFIELPKAKIVLDKDGYVVVDIGTPERSEGTLYGELLYVRSECIRFLSGLKAMVQALEQWTKKMRSSSLMPEMMKRDIENAKEDYALSVAPAYSSVQLRLREERGETINPFERMRAIFPDYETTEVAERYLTMFEDKIQSIYESEKE